MNQSLRIYSFSKQRDRKLHPWQIIILRSTKATFGLCNILQQKVSATKATILQYSFKVILYSFQIEIELAELLIGFRMFVDSLLGSLEI